MNVTQFSNFNVSSSLSSTTQSLTNPAKIWLESQTRDYYNIVIILLAFLISWYFAKRGNHGIIFVIIGGLLVYLGLSWLGF